MCVRKPFHPNTVETASGAAYGRNRHGPPCAWTLPNVQTGWIPSLRPTGDCDELPSFVFPHSAHTAVWLSADHWGRRQPPMAIFFELPCALHPL